MTTTTKLLTADEPGFGTTILRALAAAGTAIASFVKAVMNRRDVHRLLDLDDRCLKDIGLVRNDVVGALAEPPHRDPSTILMMRSLESGTRAALLAQARRQTSR